MEPSGTRGAGPDESLARWAELGERIEGEYLAHFLAQIPGSEVRQTPEGAYFRSGFPAAMFNGVTVVGTPPDPGPLVRTARELCGGRVPWGVQASERALRAWGDRFPSSEFHEYSSLPGMVMKDLHRPEPPLPQGLTVAKVSRWEEMGTFLAASALGFGFPVGAFSHLLRQGPLEGFLRDRTCSWFVGLVGGEPAATSGAVLIDGVSYVTFVSTLPRFRRRGLGEAMTWRASYAHRDSGARAAFLRATDMGAPVYRKMGYREVSTYRYLQAVGPGDRARMRTSASIARILLRSLGYRLTGGGYRRWPSGGHA